MYLSRTVEFTINKNATQFQSLVIYGARQVGKSTTVFEMFVNSKLKFNYVTLDDIDDRVLANQNPKLFLQNYEWPLVIDEIQKAPALLEQIKLIIDKQRLEWIKNNQARKLMYVLTGSNRFDLASEISDSLAGRCGIVDMYSFSNLESQHINDCKFVPSLQFFKNREKMDVEHFTIHEIFKRIFDGGMPDVITQVTDRDVFFKSYINTYLEKDVLQIINTSNEAAFRDFLQVIALRTGQVIKISEVSKIIGIDVKTVKRWISILQSSGIVYLLQPYLPNATKRVIKSPKLYFMDTGLCAYLCKIHNSEMLEKGIMSGPIFETYIVSEIIKNITSYGQDPSSLLYYYRDFDKREIDILYVANERITPIEIKKGVSPSKPSKNFNILKNYKMTINTGFVIENTDKIRPINDKVFTIPAYLI